MAGIVPYGSASPPVPAQDPLDRLRARDGGPRYLPARADAGLARRACRGGPLIALDTSALTKLVVREPETAALRVALRGHALLASELVRTELLRAVARTVPTRLAAADALVARLQLVLVTYDARQAEAARSVGLVVQAPT